MQTHSITLGMNIPNAGTVTNQMWIDFLNVTVLASLEYATITDSIGIYKGTVEKSKTISVTTEDPAAVDALRKVGDAYKAAVQSRCYNVYSYSGSLITIYMKEVFRLFFLFWTTILDITATDVPVALVAHILL